MFLSSWRDHQVDVEPFLGEVMFAAGGLLHAERFCSLVPYGTRPTPAVITVDADLCRVCWAEPWHNPHNPDRYGTNIIADVQSVTSAAELVQQAINSGITGDGFSNLVFGLHQLDQLDPLNHANVWVQDIRTQAAEAVSHAFVNRPEAIRKLVAVFGVTTVSIDEALTVIPDKDAVRIADSLSPPLIPLIVALWEPRPDVSGIVLRGPIEAVRAATAACKAVARNGAAVTTVALRRTDTPKHIETALSLLDPDSAALNTIAASLAASRAL